MKTILKLEELALFLLGIYAFGLLNYTWWWFLVLFLLPDLGFAGYFLGNKAGAFLYNLFHHKGTAVILFMIGIFLSNEPLQLTGVIFFSHSAFDRILGYGLKYEDGFKFTHLGKIGREKAYERRRI